VLRKPTTSVEFPETWPARSGAFEFTPVSMMPTVIPCPVPPSAKAAAAWICPSPYCR
jgi:hypothetical protein